MEHSTGVQTRADASSSAKKMYVRCLDTLPGPDFGRHVLELQPRKYASDCLKPCRSSGNLGPDLRPSFQRQCCGVTVGMPPRTAQLASRSPSAPAPTAPSRCAPLMPLNKLPKSYPFEIPLFLLTDQNRILLGQIKAFFARQRAICKPL